MKYYFLGIVIVTISFRFVISDDAANTTLTESSITLPSPNIENVDIVNTTSTESALPNSNITPVNFANTTSTKSSIKLPTPNIKKVNISLLNSFVNVHVKKLLNAFTKNNYELRVVGGAVRDVLMDVRPKDLDFATDATPGQMKYIFKQEKIYTINPNGEKHGTITAHMHGKNFEITTLRKDDECYGRHAKVIFTKNWQEDAARRDLTVNCMFLGFDGTLYDYCGGEEDVKNRRVRFVGDPSTRIREDFLRIMRYFRFYGRIANKPDNHDPDILTAIRENKCGLNGISGERLWLEFQQILTGQFNKDVVYKMFDVGLAPHLGLGEVDDLNRTCFETVCELKKNYEFKPITYLAALLPNVTRLKDVVSRLKLSNLERDLATFIIDQRSKPFVLIPEQPLRPYQSLLIEAKNKEQIKMFIMELLRFINVSESVVQSFATWSIPPFPFDSARLRERGIAFGRQMGFVLKGLKRHWVNKNFNVTEDELLFLIPDLVAEFRKFLSPTINWTNPPTYTRWPLINNSTSSNINISTESAPLSASYISTDSPATVQIQDSTTEPSAMTQITVTGSPSSESIPITSTETTTQPEMITLNDVTSS